MNARISKDFIFDAGIHYEGKFSINTYSIRLYLEVVTEDIREQNIAIDRIKYLLNESFSSCVFIDQLDIAAIQNYLKANMKVCPIPEGPYEQIIGSVLMAKFNSILEDKLSVIEIRISSTLCDDLNFYINYDEEMAINLNLGFWWTENNTSICDSKTIVQKKEKVVKLKREIIDWNDIGLSWAPKPISEPKIVFIDRDNQPN